jgi:hypothetical protein
LRIVTSWRGGLAKWRAEAGEAGYAR